MRNKLLTMLSTTHSHFSNIFTMVLVKLTPSLTQKVREKNNSDTSLYMSSIYRQTMVGLNDDNYFQFYILHYLHV
jgi:hypothetical protein